MSTRSLLTAALILAGLTVGISATTSTPAEAQRRYQGMSCGELWYARNQIYARRGYCFETARARRVFGPGCFPPYGRLSPGEQRAVSDIEYLERVNGC